MTEPGYIPLSELQSIVRCHGLEDIEDLSVKIHTMLRNQIKQVTGAIELAYRRGVQAGYKQAREEFDCGSDPGTGSAGDSSPA